VSSKTRLVDIYRGFFCRVCLDILIRRFVEHCHDNTWPPGSRGRNQVCLMIDKQSMQSVLDGPVPGDPDWNMRYIVDVPMRDAPDYSVVEDAHVERACRRRGPTLRPYWDYA
jgi:hypothetical protein